jgi:DNA-binding transcriptional MocR family regulator
MPLEARRLVIDFGAAGPVRRALGPAAWFVLEALADQAPAGQPQVEMACSSRALGERLGMSKDTVARAMRRLAAVGVVERIDHRNYLSGRFESSAYVVDFAAAGLSIEAVPHRAVAHVANASSRPVRRVDPDRSGDQLSLLS